MIDLVKSLTKCTPRWNAILFLSVTFFLDFVKICVFSQGCVFLGTTEYGGRKKDGAQRLCLSFQLRSFWALRTTAELFPVLPRAGFALIVPTNKFLFFKKDFIYLFIFRDRGSEGEREGEKHRLVASSMHPYQGPNQQPRQVPWPGINWQPFTLPNQLSPTNWAWLGFFPAFVSLAGKAPKLQVKSENYCVYLTLTGFLNP